MVPERPIGVDRVVQRVWTTLRGRCERLAPQDAPDDALTPTRRLEVLRQRLAALQQATVVLRPALLRFFGALDQQQKVRFAGLS